MVANDDYFILDPTHTDPKRLKKEREKAQKLRKTQWWLSLLNQGLCHYCGKKFEARHLTMDHIVPLARGGTSTQGNIVPSCRDCNREKKLETPAERLLKQLEAERQAPNRRNVADDSSEDT
jgi:5-methylcytosine-specific restriction protein A